MEVCELSARLRIAVNNMAVQSNVPTGRCRRRTAPGAVQAVRVSQGQWCTCRAMGVSFSGGRHRACATVWQGVPFGHTLLFAFAPLGPRGSYLGHERRAQGRPWQEEVDFRSVVTVWPVSLAQAPGMLPCMRVMHDRSMVP